MRKLTFYVSVICTVLIFSACSKKAESAAPGPTAAEQQELDRIGTWVTQDAEGKSEELIITKEKFGDCTWLAKAPEGEHEVKGCISYWSTGEGTDQRQMKELVNVFISKSRESKEFQEKQRQPNEPSRLKEELGEIEKTKNDYENITALMGNEKFKQIETESEIESGDCSYYDLINSKYLYRVANCMESNNGLSLTLYKRK